MTTIVTSQSELDAAIKADEERIIIDSPAGVRLYVGGSSTVTARDSSTVTARGSATVEAWDSSTVEAWGSSTVKAWGSSTVKAWDSATVEAWDSSTVEAWGSSTVEAWDSSTVTASKYTAVHLHSGNATVTGGVIIDVTALNLGGIEDWAEYHGVEIQATPDGGEAIVYKAVNVDLKSGRGFAYPIGETVTCPDWDPTPQCGAGLHFSPSPAQARDYFPGATRFLRCAVPLDDLAVIDGADTYTTPKLKARTARVLAEVDIHGKEL